MEQPQGTPTPEQPKEENLLADTISNLNASIEKKSKELTIVGRESDLGQEILSQIDAAKIELVVATKNLREVLATQELLKDIKEQKGDAKYTVAKIPTDPKSKTMGTKEFTGWDPTQL
jgi:hypothetical protein